MTNLEILAKKINEKSELEGKDFSYILEGYFAYLTNDEVKIIIDFDFVLKTE